MEEKRSPVRSHWPWLVFGRKSGSWQGTVAKRKRLGPDRWQDLSANRQDGCTPLPWEPSLGEGGLVETQRVWPGRQGTWKWTQPVQGSNWPEATSMH